MTGRLKEADERTKRELTDKCQENGWLRRGGYPWQDDPYLEEYPYEFAKAGSVEELRGFFAHGNWALRQGIVYEDLALETVVAYACEGGGKCDRGKSRTVGKSRCAYSRNLFGYRYMYQTFTTRECC